GRSVRLRGVAWGGGLRGTPITSRLAARRANFSTESRMISRSLLTPLVVCVVPTMASAGDQTILGNKLLVKNPGASEKRSVVANAKESASPNTLVGNPTTLGATLMVTANGTTSTTQTFALPSGTSGITGKPFWSGDATKGYKYKDSKGENGPVKGA